MGNRIVARTLFAAADTIGKQNNPDCIFRQGEHAIEAADFKRNLDSSENGLLQIGTLPGRPV